MEILEFFKKQLTLDKATSSSSTLKNYLSDVRHFISWFEHLTGKSFDVHLISSDTLVLYEKSLGGKIENDRLKSSTQLSTASMKRHLSSLRKFFNVLERNSILTQNPFTQIQSPVTIEPTDLWHLSSFKDDLQLQRASKMTIKNYLSDISGFAKWYEETVLPGLDKPMSSTDGFYLINQKIIQDYRNRLLEIQNAAPRTVNRKLSALRRYLNFATNKGFITASELSLDPVRIYEERQLQTYEPTIELNQLPKTKIVKSIYSKLPPVRLLQKLFINPYLLLEEKTASSIAAFIAGRPVVGMSTMPLKLASKIAAKNVLRTGSNSVDSMLGIHNVSKEFYAPEKVSLLGTPLYKRLIYHFRFTRPNWYKRYHNYAFVHYVHFALLVVFAAGVGVALYQNLVNNTQTPTFAAATAPPRILSFQGRLTDNLDNPITTPQAMRFMIYNNISSSGSAELWEETRTVSPDQDGVFSVLLGSDVNGANASSCGSFPPGSPYNTACLIPSTVFSDNSQIWLGVSVGSTSELTPRQKIATVGYATNSEFLQGLPPITSLSGSDPKINTVLALDGSGNLVIAGTSNPAPTFQATDGKFTLSGKTLALTTVLGTDTNVQIVPDGLGKLDIQKPIINTTYNGNIVPGGVEVDDKFGVLATESAVAAFMVNNNSSGGDIITASSSGTPRFTIANDGTLTDGIYSTQGGIIYGTNSTGTFGQTTAGLLGQCLQSTAGGAPTWGACGSGSPFFVSQGAIVPYNSTEDFLVGGQATSSAKFGLINVNTGNPTASISGNLIIGSPTGTNASAFLGILNNGSLSLQTSIAGDAGLTTRLFIQNNGSIGLGTSTPFSNTRLDVRGISGTGPTASISANSSDPSLLVTNSGSGDLIAASKSGVTYLRLTGNGGTFSGNGYDGELIVGNQGLGKITATIVDPVIVANQKTTGTQSLTFQTLGATNADFIFKNQATTLSTLTQAGQLQLPITGSTGGLVLGGDTQIYRGAVDRIDVASGDSINLVSGSLLTGGVTRLDSSGNGTFNTINVSSCTGCLSASNSPFQILNGAIVPLISSTDFLLGAQATTSAKFAVLNISNGTPTASVSSGLSGTGAFFDANGNFQTPNKQSLKLGGGNTGDISIVGNGLLSLGDTTISLTGGATTIQSTANNNLTISAGSGTLNLNTVSNGNITAGTGTFTIGSGGTGTLAVNGNAITTNQSAFSIVDANASTINFGRNASNTINLGGTSGTLSVGNGGSYTIQTTGNQNLAVSAGSGTLNLNTVANGPVTTGTGLTTIGGSLTVNGATTTFGNVTPVITTGTNTNLTITPNGSGKLILSSDNDTSVLVGSSTNTPAVLSVSGGIGNNAALIVNQLNSTGNILAASSSGTTKLTLDSSGNIGLTSGSTIDSLTAAGTLNLATGSNTTTLNLGKSGGTLNLPGFATNNNSVLTTGASGVVTAITTSTPGQCLVSNSGGSTPSWTTCTNPTNAPFIVSLGAIVPVNSTEDFLIGAQATGSAKFAVLNISGSNTPTASVSAQNVAGQALVLGGDGSIQSARKGQLTLGGGTSGNITVTGNGILTLADAAINLSGTNPTISANGTNTVTLNGNSSGNIQFFSSSNTFSSTGVLTASSGVAAGTNPSVTGALRMPNNTYLTGRNAANTGDISLIKVDASNHVAFGTGLAAFTLNGDIDANSNAINNLSAITFNAGGLIDAAASGGLNIGTGVNTTGLIIGKSGGTINLAGFATNNNSVLVTGASGILSAITTTTPSQCLVSNSGGSTPSWSSCVNNTNSPFQVLSGAIVPNNITEDFLIGATATNSAKFAVLGINSGTNPTASVSATTGGNNGNGIVIAGDGSLQSLQKNTLTIGGNTTGDIAFKPGNATNPTVYFQTGGNVGIGTSAPGAALDVVGNLLLGANSTIDTRSSGTLTIGNGANTTGLTLGKAGATTTFNSTSWTATPTISGLVTGTSGFSVAAGQSYTGAGAVTVSSGSNTDLTVTAQGTGKLILTSDFDTPVLIGSSTNTTAPLSVSGGIGFNALTILNQKNSGDIIAASVAGTTKFVIKNDGTASSSAGFTIDGIGNIQSTRNQTLTIGGNGTGNIVIAPGSGQVQFTNLTTNNGVLYTNSSGVVAQTLGGTSSQCLLGNLTWGFCGTGVNGSPFQELSGAIVPFNLTEDFLIGSQATTSAKFAVLNINGNNTPTASVSAVQNNTAAYISGDGSLQSVRNATLTIGGNTTGDIAFKPGNATNPTVYFQTGGNVGIGTSAPGAALDVVGNLLLGANSTIDTRSSGTLTIGNGANTTGLTLGKAGATTTFNSTSWTATPTISGLVTGTSGFSVAAGQSYTGAGAVTVSSGSNTDLTVTAQGTGKLILTSDFNTPVLIGNSGNTSSPLSVSGGIGSNALVILNQTNSGDIIAASASGTTKLQLTSAGSLNLVGGQTSDIDTLTNTTLKIGATTATTITLGRSGQGITLPGFTAQNGILYGTSGSGVIGQATTSIPGYCLQSGASNPAWNPCVDNTNSPFRVFQGAIVQNNTSEDFLIGAVSTASAKFAVLNISGSNTPTASVSAQNAPGQALILSGDGSLQSTRFNQLTIGGGNTGNITITGNGTVGITDALVKLTGTNPTFGATGTNTLTLNGSTTGNIQFFSSSNTLTSGGLLTVATGVAAGTNPSATGAFRMPNNTYLTARNAANSGDISLIRADSSNLVSFGANVAAFTLGGNISGNSNQITSLSALTLNASGLIDTAASGTINFGTGVNTTGLTIGKSGGTITFPGFDCSTGFTNGGKLTTTSGGALACSADVSGISGTWVLDTTNKVHYPINNTVDLLVGGTATSSSEFSVLGIAAGTNPTASVSATQGGNIGNGIVIAGDGSIQSLRKNSLTIGGTTTGNIIINPTGSGRVGIGTAAPLASLDLRASMAQLGGTQAIASISGKTSYAGLTIDNSGLGDLFTASAGGFTKFVVGKDGQVQVGRLAADPASAIGAGSIYYNTGTQALKFYNGSTWSSIGSGNSTSPFRETLGSIIQNYTNEDFLLGGTATTSAKFAVLNLNGPGVPTATVSGNLIVMPNNGAGGRIGIGTTSPGTLLALKTGQDYALTGSELTSNGTFTGNASGWTLSGSWAYNTNNVAHGSGTGETILQSIGISAGQKYVITFSISGATHGTLVPNLGGTDGSTYTTNYTGSQTQLITAGGSNTNITFTANGGWDGTLDSVSVKLLSTTAPTMASFLGSNGSSNLDIRGGGDGSNSYNSFIGVGTGQNNVNSTFSTGLGYGALSALTNGTDETAIGYNALGADISGADNTAIGQNAAASNTIGWGNTALGSYSLNANTNGVESVALGYYALGSNSTGYKNVGVGTFALNTNTTGINNTAIGFGADVSSSGLTNATAIGANAIVAASNALVLGGTGSNIVNVGIGTTTPSQLFEVAGSTPNIAINALGSTTPGLLFEGAGTINGRIFQDVSNNNLVLENNMKFQQTVFNTDNGRWNFYDESNTSQTPNNLIFSTFQTEPTASISGKTVGPNLLLTVNGGDLLVASNAGQTIFRLDSNGGIHNNGIVANDYGDFAEYYKKADKNESFVAGQLVCSNDLGVTRCNSSQPAQRIIGVISDRAFIVGNGVHENDPNYVLVGMVGQLGVWVTGDVKAGDPLTYSSTPGYATTAKASGNIIGYAKETNNGSQMRVESVIQPDYYNPNVALEQPAIFNQLGVAAHDGVYGVYDAFGNSINHIDAFSKAIIASLEVGFAHIRTLTVDTITAGTSSLGNATASTFAVAANTITIGGQDLKDFIINTVKNAGYTNTTIVSPLASATTIKTNVLSPLGEGSSIELHANKDNFELKNTNTGKTVGWFGDQGDATFSGQLIASGIETNSATVSGTLVAGNIQTADASVSGTLHAGSIIANNITGLDEKLATLAAAITNAQNPTSTATSSGQSGSLINGDLAVNTIHANFGIFEQGITSMGPVTSNIITATDQLAVGNSFTITNNAINTVGTDLALQSLRQGNITFEGGLIRMDTDGNMAVNGNLNILGEIDAPTGVFSGTLTTHALAAGLISPLPGDDLTIQLSDTASSAGRLKVVNNSNQEVLSVNSRGDLNASGSGTFTKLNFNLVGKAEATSLTEAVATGSAGFATLKQGQTELTIKNPIVTSKSLIYITPFGDTNNKVLYLLRQVPQTDVDDGSFTVGLSGGLAPKDLEFNWLIVN